MTEIEQKRGKLKIFMGYAAGVGKTYKMLEEAQEMRSAGKDVVVGYFEPHGRKDTIAKTEGLEIIPRKKIEYRGSMFEEMDTCAIRARHPKIALVDEFPHTNVPGSERPKRWEDVDLLLNAGIDVLTTMNIQHLESLNDQVWHITGVHVRETVPDWVVERADEVIIEKRPRTAWRRSYSTVSPMKTRVRGITAPAKAPTSRRAPMNCHADIVRAERIVKRQNAMPAALTTGMRPARSESGPKTSCPRP